MVVTVLFPACQGNVEINTKDKIVFESFVIVSQLCIWFPLRK